MKAAILILAHRNPAQVARLCRALRHPAFDLYLDIDLKTDERPFRDAIPDSVFIRRRIDVRWGAFSLVQTVLNGFGEILASGVAYDFILVASGQDYPILPMGEIAQRLAQHPGAQFMYSTRVDPRNSDYASRFIYPRYHFHNPYLTKAVNGLVRRLGTGKRRLPLEIYKGSNWMTLSSDCVRYVLEYCRTHPSVIRFFRRTHIPDEMFFQSIIQQSPFAGTIIPTNYRYIDWSGCNRSPRTLTTEDFPRLAASDDWMARKFDTEVDSTVLDLLDRYREEQEKDFPTRN